MKNKETKEMSLEELLDFAVRVKVIERIDKNTKYVTTTFDKINLKTCDAEKLCKLADAWDEVRFAMRDLVKEDKTSVNLNVTEIKKHKSDLTDLFEEDE